MSVPDFNFTSVAALANATAHNLAKASLSDLELREAIHTSKLRDGVRIGDYDIIQTTDDEETLFSIHNLRGTVMAPNLLFYDSARMIVGFLNDNVSISSQKIMRLMRHNSELRRARNDISYLETRLDQYERRGDEFRAAVQEDRLGVLRARCQYLQQELLSRRLNYL
jgi:Mg2+ and Co2+ transporter CorA